MVDSEEDVPEKAAATNEISQANRDCATQRRSLGPGYIHHWARKAAQGRATAKWSCDKKSARDRDVGGNHSRKGIDDIVVVRCRCDLASSVVEVECKVEGAQRFLGSAESHASRPDWQA